MAVLPPPRPAAAAAAPGRRALLDMLRGLALVGMVAYHGCYNLSRLFQVDLPWFDSAGARVWQFCTSALFLILAGVCTHFTRHVFARAARLAAVALGLTLVTLLFLPQEVIVFGILHCIAACLLLYGALRPWLACLPPRAGMLLFGFLFVLTFHLPHRYLFFQPYAIPLPAGLYAFYPLSLVGFQSAAFFSADYFPVIPYLFLFLFGHYLGYLFLRLPHWVQALGCRPLNFLGRHSLLIYLAHQPLLLGGILLLF